MSWNANDLEHLTLIDRVKRLERSALKPNEDGGYDETSPNLTERVDALEIKGLELPFTRVGSNFEYLITSESLDLLVANTLWRVKVEEGQPVGDITISYGSIPTVVTLSRIDPIAVIDYLGTGITLEFYDTQGEKNAILQSPAAYDIKIIVGGVPEVAKVSLVKVLY